MARQYYSRISLLVLSSLALITCLDNDDTSRKINNCSVVARCEGQPELEIRLRQVETYYFESKDDIDSQAADLAQFDYNNNNQWVGGVTRRVSESNFEYQIEYTPDGKMSKSIRSYTDDLGQEALLTLDYSYNDSLLYKSDSFTEIRDIDDNLIKTIDEEIYYSYNNGKVDDIHFNVNDSKEGFSDFHYQVNYQDNLVIEIHITGHSNGQVDHLFKSYQYDNQARVSTSLTQRLKNSSQPEEHETITYEYYPDGPLRVKTSIINTIPEQKIVTRYLWESGECATNQTFGDRLFPTPEVPNFPCYQR